MHTLTRCRRCGTRDPHPLVTVLAADDAPRYYCPLCALAFLATGEDVTLVRATVPATSIRKDA